MSVKYSAREAFEMAGQIERNGAEFYRLAAASEQDPSRRRILDSLRAMELDHEKVFASMAAESAAGPGDDWFDPDGQAALYMRALAGGAVFGPGGDAAAIVAGAKSAEDVLRRAIVLEKDSIMFYLGIRKATPADLGRDRVDAIIDEEMKHVVTLDGLISGLRRAK